jgi:arginyl-tRNA synthetase
MIEYSQPNTNKPMHIGHARNTIIGDSLARIMKFSGFRVITANYFGDIGLHIAKTILAYEKWGEGREPDKKPDHFVGDFYTKFNEELGKNPKLEAEAREILRKWEANDKKIIDIWKKLRDWCIKGFEQTYEELGVHFDIYLYESDVHRKGKEVALKVLNKGIAFKTQDGAIVADLEKFGLPNCVILRADGTSLYSTKDLALGILKFEKYKIEKSIYVVGAEQKLYFQQIFKILELLGYEYAKNCFHLAYGLVMLPEGKMSSRAGIFVLLDDIIEELKNLAYNIVSKNNPELEESEKRRISKIIAIGALKYALLKVSPEKDIMFEKEKIIQFEGNTGPYLQYAHTRCLSILRKAESWEPNISSKLNPYEKSLVKHLASFPEIVKNSAKDMRPHYICNYAYELANLFSTFYQNCPVLKAEEKRDFRLTLVKCTSIVLKKCLELMGIEVPGKM